MIFLNVFYLITFTSYKNFSFNFKYNNLTNIYSNTICTKDYGYTCDNGYTRDSIHTKDYGYTTNGSKRDNKLNSKLGINYEDLMNNNELDEIRKEKKIKIPYFVEYPIDKVIDEPDITKEDLVKSILSELGFFSSSVTVSGPTASTNHGTVGASTVTKGKGANFTAMECTSEKILNTIAAVTKSGESGTFSEDTNEDTTNKETPFRGGREPHSVTGKDYLIKTSIIDKFDNMKNEMESSIISEEISPSLGKQRVRWFPNHISRSLSQLHYYLKMSDIILDVRDGRIPFISPDDYFFNLYEQEFPNKPRIIVFTHSDKLPKIAMSQWLKYYRIIFRNIYKSYVTGSSVTVSGPPNSTNRTKGTTSTSQTISPTNSTKDISTTGPSTVTEDTGKGANFTAMECTPGKGANFMPMECTLGKGANLPTNSVPITKVITNTVTKDNMDKYGTGINVDDRFINMETFDTMNKDEMEEEEEITFRSQEFQVQVPELDLTLAHEYINSKHSKNIKKNEEKVTTPKFSFYQTTTEGPTGTNTNQITGNPNTTTGTGTVNTVNRVNSVNLNGVTNTNTISTTMGNMNTTGTEANTKETPFGSKVAPFGAGGVNSIGLYGSGMNNVQYLQGYNGMIWTGGPVNFGCLRPIQIIRRPFYPRSRSLQR